VPPKPDWKAEAVPKASAAIRVTNFIFLKGDKICAQKEKGY
jgi:hypothetical protein